MKNIRILAPIAAAVLLGFAAGLVSHADDLPQACSEHLPYGVPTIAAGLNVTPICHEGYTAMVDNDALVPRWVAYRLTADHTLGCLDRTNNFHAEGDLPKGRRASPSDFDGSGHDKGHMGDAADFEWSQTEERDSFSMANMAPQLPGLNRMEWERLEETVRAWAWGRGEVLIYVGPILHGGEPTIGANHVAVPAAFFKAVVDMHTGEAIGFEMPQKDIAKGDLAPWLRPISIIEHDAEISLPMPAMIDKAAAVALWPANLKGWRKAHAAACPS